MVTCYAFLLIEEAARMTSTVERLQRVRDWELGAAAYHAPKQLWTAERQAMADLERIPGAVSPAERARLVDAARAILTRLADAGPIPVS